MADEIKVINCKVQGRVAFLLRIAALLRMGLMPKSKVKKIGIGRTVPLLISLTTPFPLFSFSELRWNY